MDLLKKFWPHAFGAKGIVGLIITVIVYCVIEVVLGWVCSILGAMPIIGIVAGLIGGLLGLYCGIGIILAILVALKILK